MDYKSENIFYKSRLQSGFKTRVEAAELLFISYDSLADYETDVTVPSEDMVFAMAELYGDPFLIFEHFQNSRTGKLYQELFGLEILRSDLTKTTLGFIKELNDLEGAKVKELIGIVHNGKWDELETEWAGVFIREVAGLVKQAVNLICQTIVKINEKATPEEVA